MRVISGKAKGTQLLTIDEISLRPTSDRAKEALFNIIGYDIQDKSFLDLFGGSGSIGIEAASRRANSTIIELRLNSYNVIKKNIAKTRLSNIKLEKNNSLDFLLKTKDKYDYIFLDPPYDSNLYEESIKMIMSRTLLKKDGMVIAEIDSKNEKARQNILDQIHIFENNLELIDERKYGRNKFLFIKSKS